MRLLFTLLAAQLIVAGGQALAQSGALAGVTMRLVEDLSGIDAVVLELESAPAENAEDAERPAAEERESEDASGRRERDDAEGGERAAPPQPRA